MERSELESRRKADVPVAAADGGNGKTVIPDPYCPLGKGGSETSFFVNLLALALAIGVTVLARLAGVTATYGLYGVLLVSVLVFSVVLEAAFHPKTCFLKRLRRRRSLSWKRVAFRETALLVTFGCIALVYWALPLFSDKAMLKCYYPFLSGLVPVLLILSVPYFCLMDRIDPEEEDVLCRVGRAILTGRRTVTRFELANYVRSWLVKAFWLSIMQPAVCEKICVFLYYRWQKLAGSPMECVLMASTICYAIDLCYASTGYALNFKLFNTQTRTAEPTLLGWAVAACCYWPFYGILFYPYFFKYDSSVQWNSLFVSGSVIWWLWAGVIVTMELLYALSTVSAGIRFSNLTYRGLWKTGPYRLTKHPAYVFKCISWWFVYVPFATNSGAAAVKCTLLLLGVNVLYYFRARTEERHLSHYPEYVDYALEMNRRSIFRWCGRLLPFLKYRAPLESTLLFHAQN